MRKRIELISILLLSAAGIFIIDQAIKQIFLDGYRYIGDCIDLILVYNRGVAFSMFAFLAESLKWIQIALLSGVVGYTLWLGKRCYVLPVGIMAGAGFSNVWDRFLHGGVVDYVYWHCGFDFAVFNFADVMIDVAVLGLFLVNLKPMICKND